MALRFVAAKLFVVLSVAVRLPQRRPRFVRHLYCGQRCMFVRMVSPSAVSFCAIRFGEKTRDRVDAHGHIDGCE
jgi:hypothetical protein